MSASEWLKRDVLDVLAGCEGASVWIEWKRARNMGK